MCRYYWVYQYFRCGHQITAADLDQSKWVRKFPCVSDYTLCDLVVLERNA